MATTDPSLNPRERREKIFVTESPPFGLLDREKGCSGESNQKLVVTSYDLFLSIYLLEVLSTLLLFLIPLYPLHIVLSGNFYTNLPIN